jgi:hypothetical protein
MRAWPVLLALFGAMVQAPPQDAARVATSARALQPGEVVAFTVTTPDPDTPSSSTSSIAPGPCFRLMRPRGAGWWDRSRHASRSYTAVILVSAGSAEPTRVTRQLSIVAKSFGTRTLTVDDSFVNPPADVGRSHRG